MTDLGGGGGGGGGGDGGGGVNVVVLYFQLYFHCNIFLLSFNIEMQSLMMTIHCNEIFVYIEMLFSSHLNCQKLSLFNFILFFINTFLLF